jgi:CubicO group peptidase (beta-lactamase class C family)
MDARSDLDERVRAATGRSVPGVVLIVVGPEGVRARSAAGAADLVVEAAMTAHTSMPWFSMTKIVTATAAMRLAERGVLDLDAPVTPLVPAMAALVPEERRVRITPRHLLQHAAGLTNPIPVGWIHPAGEPGPDPDAFLEGLLRKHAKLGFDPGSRSSYSNLGALVLGAAMARAASVPFTDLARREVLQPAGMAETGFDRPKGAATGYHPRRSPMRLLLPRWVIGEPSGRWIGFRPFVLDGAAYGGLIGTPEDAARVLRMHLRGGDLDGARILSPEAASEMRTIRVQGKRYDLGLGWFRPVGDRGADPPFVEHLGGGAGFFNVMRLYPTAGVGAVVMGNATRYDIDRIASLALSFRDG